MTCKHKKKTDHAKKINYIACIYYPAAKTFIVKIYSQCFDIVAGAGSKIWNAAYGVKPCVHKKTGECANYKRNNCIIAETAAANANSSKDCRQ